jgi:hypothetical protein
MMEDTHAMEEMVARLSGKSIVIHGSGGGTAFVAMPRCISALVRPGEIEHARCTYAVSDGRPNSEPRTRK